MKTIMLPQKGQMTDLSKAAAMANPDIESLLSRLPSTMATYASAIANDHGLSETEIALRLAMIAMTEAERRIERQARRIAYLESLSMTDELTGLLNRRGFRAQLRKALATSKRQAATGVLLLIDLDKFKQVNDTYGHAAGDALLTAVAEILRNRTREADTVARLGGDEFAVLLNGATDAEAESRIKALEKDLNSRVLHWNGHDIPLGASVGFDSYGAEDTDNELLDRVDRKMYAEKSRRDARRKA